VDVPSGGSYAGSATGTVIEVGDGLYRTCWVLSCEITAVTVPPRFTGTLQSAASTDEDQSAHLGLEQSPSVFP
jgi:hypothetical protein